MYRAISQPLVLESQQFDRSGERGRMFMLSLQTVDAEFIGLGSDWPQIMNVLDSKNRNSQVGWVRFLCPRNLALRFRNGN